MGTFNIIMQFVFQTGGIVLLTFILAPISSQIAFDSGLFDDTAPQTQALRDAYWNWFIIIGVVAMGGNVIWLYRAVQTKGGQIQSI